MKNTWIIYVGFIALSLFASCETEETLTPSHKDVDRVADFVSSSDKALVSTVYNTYGMGLLYEYDLILDFAYTAENDDASELWGGIELPMMREQFLDSNKVMSADSLAKYNAYVDKALAFMDTALFKCIGEQGFIAEHMPYKILLTNNIIAASPVYNNLLTESESRTGSVAENSLNCVYNAHSMALNVNQDALRYNADKFRKDNFYIFICRLMELYDMYELLPEEFSLYTSEYYGQSIEEVYAEDFGIDLEDTSQDTLVVPDVVDKQWFYSKGFVDARFFYNRPTGLTTIDGEVKAIKKSYTFLEDEELDFRSYLNEMLHRNADELSIYPEIVKGKMNLLIQTLNSWGVDLVVFNPGLKVIMND